MGGFHKVKLTDLMEKNKKDIAPTMSFLIPLIQNRYGLSTKQIYLFSDKFHNQLK